MARRNPTRTTLAADLEEVFNLADEMCGALHPESASASRARFAVLRAETHAGLARLRLYESQDQTLHDDLVKAASNACVSVISRAAVRDEPRHQRWCRTEHETEGMVACNCGADEGIKRECPDHLRHLR